MNGDTENSFILFFVHFHSINLLLLALCWAHGACTSWMERVTAQRNGIYGEFIMVPEDIWYSNVDRATLTGALNSILRHLPNRRSGCSRSATHFSFRHQVSELGHIVHYFIIVFLHSTFRLTFSKQDVELRWVWSSLKCVGKYFRIFVYFQLS